MNDSGNKPETADSATAERRSLPRPVRAMTTRLRRDGRGFRSLIPRRREILPFLAYVGHRFVEDRCPRMAAGLGYTSLLAIVPLTAIAFAMLAAFPVFEDVRERFQDMMFANLLPQSADAMRDYFARFVANSATLSAVGIVALAVTAVLLLSTIEADMNTIFRVTRPRRLAPRLLVFWAVITLGPLLLGASFSISTYLYAASRWVGIGDPLGPLAHAVPTLFIILMLVFFYIVIPNRPVRLSAGALGGIVAGLMFTGLRELFGWYVSNFPAYQTIYGALSVIPIFLVWLYLSWLVVLFGAVLAASLTEWRDAGGRPMRNPMEAGPKLVTALRILGVLQVRSQRGGTVPRGRLLRAADGGDAVLDAILTELREGDFVDQTNRGGWVLCRDMATTTLFDLYRTLGLAFSERDIEFAERGWEGRIAETLRRVQDDNRTRMNVSLRTLLAEEADRVLSDESDGGEADDPFYEIDDSFYESERPADDEVGRATASRRRGG